MTHHCVTAIVGGPTKSPIDSADPYKTMRAGLLARQRVKIWENRIPANFKIILAPFRAYVIFVVASNVPDKRYKYIMCDVLVFHSKKPTRDHSDGSVS